MVEASDGRLVAGDTVGLSGLQARYDEHLGGTRGVRVTRVPVEGEPEELLAVTATDGPDLALTFDTAIQQAGDDALTGSTAGNGNAALVAMDTSTGNILAVANTPATGENRALTGRYAPGSTFKAVSTLALLDSGLTPAETVPCPATATATATVAGRSFRATWTGSPSVPSPSPRTSPSRATPRVRGPVVPAGAGRPGEGRCLGGPRR